MPHLLASCREPAAARQKIKQVTKHKAIPFTSAVHGRLPETPRSHLSLCRPHV